MQHVNGHLGLVQLQHSHLSRAIPEEAPNMASVLILTVRCLVCANRGVFTPKAAAPRPKAKIRGSKPSSTKAWQPVARQMKHHALVLVSPTFLVLETELEFS